ncbi:MAG: hypothetical protein H6623_05340 [Bdellovibrionaceae bacterium]|nr:hypothetical protein [Pseudobdellovibrionaceae bacterium]
MECPLIDRLMYVSFTGKMIRKTVEELLPHISRRDVKVFTIPYPRRTYRACPYAFAKYHSPNNGRVFICVHDNLMIKARKYFEPNAKAPTVKSSSRYEERNCFEDPSTLQKSRSIYDWQLQKVEEICQRSSNLLGDSIQSSAVLSVSDMVSTLSAIEFCIDTEFPKVKIIDIANKYQSAFIRTFQASRISFIDGKGSPKGTSCLDGSIKLYVKENCDSKLSSYLRFESCFNKENIEKHLDKLLLRQESVELKDLINSLRYQAVLRWEQFKEELGEQAHQEETTYEEALSKFYSTVPKRGNEFLNGLLTGDGIKKIRKEERYSAKKLVEVGILTKVEGVTSTYCLTKKYRILIGDRSHTQSYLSIRREKKLPDKDS